MADETARASYDMLENLVYRASRLSLSTGPAITKSGKMGSIRRGSSATSSESHYQGSASGRYSDNSGDLGTDEVLGSLGYSYEHAESMTFPDPPQSFTDLSCSWMDAGFPHGMFTPDSPGPQTLAALKQEAAQDRQN